MVQYVSLGRSARIARTLTIVLVLSLAALPQVGSADIVGGFTSTPGRSSAEILPQATEVRVYKAQRRLELWQGKQLLRNYRVSLGLEPIGHKRREGDSRTPEGRYRLTARNERSDFFLSILVSYPGKEDVERARREGVSPGGLIMIHGLPNDMRFPSEYYANRDWTDGCIALNNADMMEVWMLVPPGTPIHIKP
jgi:murein L,D-transpeptidase YafK